MILKENDIKAMSSAEQPDRHDIRKPVKDVDGTAGFSPQLAGRGKVGRHNTSGFPMPVKGSFTPFGENGQQAPGQKRDATASMISRITEDNPSKKTED